MLSKIPEMPQHFILAVDRHRQLLDEAQRQRTVALAQPMRVGRRDWWRHLRGRMGTWLIRMGQQIAADAPAASPRAKRVWG